MVTPRGTCFPYFPLKIGIKSGTNAYLGESGGVSQDLQHSRHTIHGWVQQTHRQVSVLWFEANPLRIPRNMALNSPHEFSSFRCLCDNLNPLLTPVSPPLASRPHPLQPMKSLGPTELEWEAVGTATYS